MRPNGMADALKAQQQHQTMHEVSFLDRLAMLVDQQWSWRENQVLQRRLKAAKARGNTCVEDIDYRASRGLDKSVIRALTQESSWVAKHENIFVLGPTGIARVMLPRRWRRRPAVTVTLYGPRVWQRCSAISIWRVPTAVCAACWRLARNGYVPYVLYVRGRRRLESVYIFSEPDAIRVPGFPHPPLQKTSIAVGDWSIDSHPVSRDTEGYIFLHSTSDTYKISAPYQGYLRPWYSGVLMASWCPWRFPRHTSVSRCLEPIRVSMGQAAGNAAALCVKRDIQPRDVPPPELQRMLLDEGNALFYYTDVLPANLYFKDTQYLSQAGVVHGFSDFTIRPAQLATKAESDTPRRAGGLMSWAASKAVGVLSRRRALRASVRSSELPAGTIRGVLLADVLAHLLQVESDCGHRVTAGPEVFAGEVSLLSAQACNRNGTLPLQEPNHRGDWVLGWNRDTHVHRVRHQMPFHNLAFLLFRQRVENCSQLLAYLPEDHFPAPFGNEYHVILAVPLGVG